MIPSEFPTSGGTLFEAMPQLGWLANADGWISYYNRRWYDYTGTTPEQMAGWGWQSVHDPALLPSVLERWRTSIATGEPFEMSFPLRRHDGVFRWFKTHASPLRDASGAVVSWVGINTDIDDQKRAEAALDSQWRRVESMFVEAPAAIAVIRGPEHVFEMANPLYCALVGRTSEQLVGRAAREALPELTAQGVWEVFDRVRSSGQRFVADAFPAKLDRHGTGVPEQGYLDLVGQPVHGADGSVERIMMFAVDITSQVRERERVEALALTEQAAREAAQAARARLEDLMALAFALSGAVAVSDVANIVVEQGSRRARADTCTLYSLDEAGHVLELLAHRGIAPEVLGKIQRISRRDGNPAVFEAMTEGRAIWVETESAYALEFPEIAKLPSTGARAKAFWSMPLVVEGHPVGLLAMGFYEERKFDKDERDFVDAFAKQCAQALLRAQRRDRERTQRRWLSTTLQSIGDAVIATDPEGRVTFMNAIAERLTGWSEPDARGRALDEVFAIFSEATHEPVENPVTKVLREGTVVGLANHTVLRSKSGTEIPIDDSGAPIRDEHGAIFGVVLVFRDVTMEKASERRRDFVARAADALIASLDYRATLARVAELAVPQLADWCAIEVVEAGESAPKQVAVAHTDPAKLAYAREWGERYPPDPNAKTGVPEVIRSGKSELYPEIPAGLLEAAAIDEEHLRLMRELHLESAMVVPLPGRSGRVLGAMTFIYAASERRYTTDDLAFAEDFAKRAGMAIENAMALKEVGAARERERLLRTEAERANTAKDEFLATVSHELRTPLNAILGWSVTLRRREMSPDVAKAIGVIERNARSQARLIDDVLDVSRIISGKLPLAMGPVDVRESMRVALEGIKPAAEAKGIEVSSHVTGENAIIVADADRLQQILWNLLTNAVKFTPKRGTITTRVEVVGSEVQIEVTDSGEGIRPDALPRIFEPFRQADNSTTRRHGGLGLGLALVKQLVAAHGGSVHARSDGEGRGSTFHVTLPIRSAIAAVGRPDRPTPDRIDVAPRSLQRLDRLQILVVDDELDARDLVGHTFRDLGASVRLAFSAADALEQIMAGTPDVIVSDIGMPEVDGYAFIRSVRAMPPGSGGLTPAVALTAYSRPEDARRALDAGFQQHVAKPVDPAELVRVVASLVGGATKPPS